MSAPDVPGERPLAAGSWSAIYDELSAADREALDIDDLERLALAAYLIGKDEDSADAWTRAHHEGLRRGDAPRAARNAFWHACGLLFKGDFAPAMGWIARGRRVLEESGEDCVEQGWLLLLIGLPIMFGGDPSSAFENFVQSGEIADRFGDPDVQAFSRLARGQAICMMGNTAEGVSMLDEVMVAVTSGEVSPIVSGIAYCATIDACNTVFDLRRAREWTAALSRWCDSQPDLVPFRGNCLVHRCEIFQLQGAWPEALDAAQRACEWLSGPVRWDSLGSAYYELAEIRRLRGEYGEAEEAYRNATKAGREPEPGLSLLRLAQKKVDVATAAIRRVVDETKDPSMRARVLPAHVEIMLASGDVEAARGSVDELAEIAAFIDAPLVRALASESSGALLLAEGRASDALATLRDACTAWRDLDAPYRAARSRVLLALACRALGDEGTAEMELDAALSAFEELGAAPDVARVKELLGVTKAPTAGGLSPREVEVLRHIAAGKTNRAIASELVLSEKTVARHVSNIFAKLGVPSRAAATAYAYEHDLV